MIRGTRTRTGDCLVTIDGKRLDPAPSQKLVNHSPDGFSWGYRGSGPAQLALAILLHYCKEPGDALRLYQKFKEKKIATLPIDQPWTMSRWTVVAWLRVHGVAVKSNSLKQGYQPFVTDRNLCPNCSSRLNKNPFGGKTCHNCGYWLV